MTTCVEILCGIAVVIIALYYYFVAKFDFWKNQGVAGPKPTPVLGNIKDMLLGRIGIGDFTTNLYKKYKNEPMIGIFARRTPIVILTDPDLIKDVLIKDFSNFSERGLPIHEKTDPFTLNLFTLETKRWRPLRSRLSPVFTSGKLKEMFSLIVECSNHLEVCLEKLVAKGEPIECREMTAQFTTDVIGTCAFGIEMNAMSEEDNEFRRMGRKIFDVNLREFTLIILRQSLPWLYDLLGYVLPEKETTKFFRRLIMDTMKYRREHKIVRHDFVNMLMELQDHPEKLGDFELTLNLLTAQAFVFFAAGFETSSTTMSNALYELALNQKIQDKLREEIKEEFQQHGQSLTYENIKEMKYLDKVFRETLRKYPPVTVLMRQARDNYTFHGTKVTIPKGMKIWIPAFALQRDSDIYPDPDVFDPERFSEEIAATRHPMYYLPFGDGPRNCIGARFAVYQTKIGLIKILKNHKVDVCEKTKIPYEHDPKALILSPIGGIHLKIIKAE